MIVDVHHHMVAEDGYVDRLLLKMDDLGIEKAGLIAMGPLFQRLFVEEGHPVCDAPDEHAVRKAVQSHPDRFFGYVYVRLGYDGRDKLRKWGELGFKGVKLHIPKENYDHYDYLPVYEAARELGMVCLFHTGLFYIPSMAGERASAERTRPVHVEAVINEMPDLKVILAHMGGVWAEEACGMMRMFPNVYADMSGRLDGWRSAKPASWFREMLYWPTAEDKLVFGSDVRVDELADTVSHQLGVLKSMGWDQSAERKFLGETAQNLFGLD